MAVRNYIWTNSGATFLWGDSANWDGNGGFGYPGDGGGTDNVLITTGTVTCDQNTGGHITIQNLTVSGNNASHDLELNNGLIMQGNASIDAGEVKTQGLLFSVASGTTLGAGTGNNAAVLVCGDSVCSFGSGYTAGVGLEIKVGGTFSGGTGPHTMGSLKMGNSNNARATLTAGNTIIDSEDNGGTSGGLNIYSADTFSHGGGTIIFTYPSYTLFRPGSPNVLNNVILSGATEVKQADSPSVMEGYLTILSGTYTTNDEDLTVSGTTTIGGGAGASLICNDSTCRFGDAQDSFWGILMAASGTFNGGGGTHTTGGLRCSESTAAFALSSGTTTIKERSAYNNRFFTFEAGNVTHSSGELIIMGNFTSYCQWEAATSGDDGPWDLTINHWENVTKLRQPMTILNDLTITAGEFNTFSYSTNHALTVDGDVSIADGGTLTGNDSAISLGSVTIADGGTYDATSGITELTAGTTVMILETDSGTPGGTFVHNDGTVDISKSTGRAEILLRGPGNLYNLTTSHANTEVWYQRNFTIENDLNITSGSLRCYDDNPRTLTVSGLAVVEGTLGGGDSNTADNSFNTLTIGSAGTYNSTSGSTTIAGNLINNGGNIY